MSGKEFFGVGTPCGCDSCTKKPAVVGRPVFIEWHDNKQIGWGHLTRMQGDVWGFRLTHVLLGNPLEGEQAPFTELSHVSDPSLLEDLPHKGNIVLRTCFSSLEEAANVVREIAQKVVISVFVVILEQDDKQLPN